MSELLRSPLLSIRLWTVVALVTITLPAFAQDSIKLKNSMRAPITVLIQPEQLTAPADFEIRVDDIFDYKLAHEGPYTVQVIPHDQLDSGYHLGTHDLRRIAKALQGKPLELEGDFSLYRDTRSGRLFQVREAVHFDTPMPERSDVFRFTGRRLDYLNETTRAQQAQNDLKPTATTAVIAAVTPAGARLAIDGTPMESAGPLRYYVTPPLDPNKTYIYSFTVEWTKEGHECKATKDVEIRPGEVTRVFFKLPIEPTPVVLLVPKLIVQ